ncbi:hypothetical protein Ahy_A02g009685 isoform E [Arachis hypogaea]|uniref:Uncharacterized protein n=1 Tax=Arachis hypogaea TaxID=3818 RepID=A0A445EHP7_ARAHY|nr:hypothetical protein Ahy_A02g009685 isoform E [Arachis hypogaea]
MRQSRRTGRQVITLHFTAQFVYRFEKAFYSVCLALRRSKGSLFFKGIGGIIGKDEEERISKFVG